MVNSTSEDENSMEHGDHGGITNDFPATGRKVLRHLELNERVVQRFTGLVGKKIFRLTFIQNFN